MCKVFAMTDMTKVKVTKKLLNAVRAEVCRTGDKHGFGYAVLNDDGSIGGERTMRPEEFSPLGMNPDDTMTGSLPCVLRTRDQFGELNFGNAKSFIAHGRYSTNEVTLENTHPFFNGELALIHNGVVSDNDGVIPKADLKTTNDTEIIFRCWERGGMKLVETTVSGYYALAVLDAVGHLHIVRDDTASLYIAYSRTVDSYIIATTAEIIRGVAKKMAWKIEQPEELLENIHVVWDRNEIVKQVDITPRVDTNRRWSAKEASAFGDGATRAHSHNNYYEGFMGSVMDATKSSVDDEPTYREGVQDRMKAAALEDAEHFHNAIAKEDLDRTYIDDGAPNVKNGVGYNETADDCDEIYQSAYSNGYIRKTS